jgi:hypothetical protein
LLPQDVSRMGVLSLKPLPSDQPEPKITARQAERLGRRLMRRLADQWGRADATIGAYRGAMQLGGHDARGQDVFGVLLACADMLLYDHPPDADTLAGWTDKMQADSMAELDVETCDERACLSHLLTARLDNAKDRLRMTVGEWLRCAAGRLDDPPATVDGAQRTLAEVGIKVDYQGGPQPRWIIIGCQHQGLTRLFDGTRWAGRPGATAVYVQALKRLPHELPRDSKGRPKPIYVGGSTMRAILLPIDLCLPPRSSGARWRSDAEGPETWTVGAPQPRDGPASDAD